MFKYFGGSLPYFLKPIMFFFALQEICRDLENKCWQYWYIFFNLRACSIILYL